MGGGCGASGDLADPGLAVEESRAPVVVGEVDDGAH